MKLLIKRRCFMIPAVCVIAFCLIAGTLFFGEKKINLGKDDFLHTDNKYTAAKASEDDYPADDAFITASENERWQLEVNTYQNIFRITDKQSKTVRYSGQQVPENQQIIPRNRNIMQTTISMTYLETADATETSVLTSCSDGVGVTCGQVEDGFEFVYLFDETGISVTVQIRLDSTGFFAVIPKNGIEEKGKARIVSADLLPSFGSVFAEKGNSIVYPDGCGALYSCSPEKVSGTLYSANVYSERTLELDTENTDRENGVKHIVWPYFGSSSKDTGIIGFVVSGAATARIAFSEGNSTLNLNRIYSSSVYRHKATQKTEQGQRDVYPDECETGEFCVKYLLLNGEAADYSGMANALRNFFRQTGILPEKASHADSVPIALDILLGTEESTLFGKSELALTNYCQAQNMLKSLDENGVNNYYAYLLGWQKGGYGNYPQSVKPSYALGGKSELKKLLSLDNGKNRRVFLQTDYLYASENGSFSKQQDIVYNFLHKAASDSNESLFLLNPLRQLAELKNNLSVYGKLGASSVAFDSLSNWLPSDNSEDRKVAASDATNIYASMVMLSAKSGKFTAVQRGNDYLLGNAGTVYDLYDSNSNTIMFDKTIPFLQIVLHGILPYSCETPGNIASDFTEVKLHWLEYGAMPYFLVMEEANTALQNTSISDVFSSRFDEWKSVITDCSREFNSEQIKNLFSQTVTKHENLTADTVRVTYESGDCLLINYGENETNIGDTAVGAKSYKVVRCEGGDANE